MDSGKRDGTSGAGEVLDPKDDTIRIEEWWTHHHKGKGDYEVWLTGSEGPEVWNRLGVDALVRPGSTVLNIGVGLGRCTRSLAERGCIVHAHDISPAALERVAPFVARGWLPGELGDLPGYSFDLAISHLVTQHMSDVDLVPQMAAVLKALKPTGVFAMQFAFGLDGAVTDQRRLDPVLIKGGGVLRSLSGLASLVEMIGGDVMSVWRSGTFPEHGSGWFSIQIVRKDFPWRRFSG